MVGFNRTKVIQWATGSMGRTSMRMVLDHDEMDLVGALVYSDRKAGLDLGEIAKRPETGIKTTRSKADIMAVEADVVIHMPRITLPYEAMVPDVIALLESGKNVISTAGFHWPEAQGEAYANALKEAAIKGGATLAGVGVNPGLVAERLIMSAAAMSVDINEISLFETVDASAMTSGAFVFDLMGLGSDPAKVDIRKGPLAELYSALFSEIFYYCAHHFGSKIAKITPDHKLTLAPKDIHLIPGVIKKGSVAATEWFWTARLENGTDIVLSIIWTADTALHESDKQGHWMLKIKGRPNITMTLDISEPDPDKPPSRALTDAVCAVAINAVPDVIAAPPGLFAFAPIGLGKVKS
ncbi:hypothetical protein DES40_1523 [Litorimonas taeanensis]|uniref:Dihydrodipicolinate reductase N-terminal domain-containing protein n=1 Tax=Litorimonas taeanensis TaxID=568099 RepID=A0A420WMR2_9PROT|nr:hypothetical protein [Litorimonas taeanensis]RKQ72186.1 hypothetical protein DES40_1523 [Litorimonas taeanensis]